METQRGCDAHDQEHSRAIFRALSILNQTKQKRHIQPTGDEHAFESLLFSPRGHHEISIANGDVAQLILTAVAKSFAPESAGTDGNLRLQHLVTGTFCVVFRVQEGSYPLPLVRFQDVAANRRIENAPNSQYPDQRNYRRMLPLQAGKESSHYEHGQQYQSGTQIGLL